MNRISAVQRQRAGCTIAGMNIQIFGKPKCFDTRKAERYFKERGIRFQSINVLEKPPSVGELKSIIQAAGSIEALIDTASPRYSEIAYLESADIADKLCEVPVLFRTPIVRNGRQATVGYSPEVWKTWE